MMKRLRLNRPLCLALLAITSLVVVSYFPLTKTRAASAGATILPSAGKPLVNLKNPQTLKVTYTGSASAVAALQKGTAIPTALAAADFDADGAMDMVAGYSTKNGGILALLRGNPDAFAPTDTTLYQKAMQGNVPPTFLSKVPVFTLPESPDMIVTGDFNRDGYKDVLVAARGGSLYLLAGDGKGNFAAPQIVALADTVMALAAAPDGHVAVSTDGRSGPQVTILAPNAGGLAAGQTFALPTRGTSVAWGTLGGGADVAVGAGSNVVMIYGALGANAQTETVSVPFTVQGLALGDFIWDRDGRTEIAILADDGSIHILQHGTLNTTPLTAAELPARQAAIRGHHTQPATPPNPTALGAWTVAKQISYAGSAPSGPVSPSAFNSPRLASSSTPDLMVLDAAASQLHILDTSGKTASPSADVSFSGTPVAALALPQKIDAGRDIVVLTSSQAAPLLVTSETSLTLNVTTTADEDPTDICGSSSTTVPSPLSLREAVCIANNSAPDTTTINVPPGTYSLTSLETGELRQGTGTAYTLTINGTGTAANTIIQQTDGVDRILEEDYALAGNNPVTIENVTISGGHCTNITTNDCQFGGGAIIAGGEDGDDLTLTNVVMSSNSTGGTAIGDAGNNSGGAVSMEAPSITITSSLFLDNTAADGGIGGGVYFLGASTGTGCGAACDIYGSISITNSTFTSNVSGEGGGVYYTQLTAPQTVTITGSNFSGNQANGGSLTGEGGAVFGDEEGGASTTITGNRFVNDSAAASGKGLFMEGGGPVTATNNWWGCNAGPGNLGCDTAVANADGTTVTSNPWLVLGLSANPTQIDPSGTSTLTADLTHNSNGTGGFSFPNGVEVEFSTDGTLGTVNTTFTGIINGMATSTYTAGSTAGNDSSITAMVDNQSVNTTINILDSVTVTTSPANLSITVDSVTYTAPQTFNWVVGSTHTLNTNSPQSGPPGSQYVWSSWSQGGTQSQTVTAPTATTTYTASFNTQYQLTTQALPSADGSVTPASGSYYAGGAIIPVTATPNTGFQFSNWTSTGGSFVSTTSPSTNFTMPSAPATVTGNFTSSTVQITITTSPANLLVSADGGTFTAAPLTESWNPGSSHTIATTSPQSGGTGVQYVFTSWSDGGAISHSITVPSSATTYTATFSTQYQLTTAANPSNGGTVSPASGGFYNASTVVPLTATPNANYTFSNWTGNVANSSSASTTVTMSGPQSVTANFVATQLTASPPSLNFGNKEIGGSHPMQVTVQNVGTTKVTVGTVSLTSTGGDPTAFSFHEYCQPRALKAGAKCIIGVTFTPHAAGLDTATLNIPFNGPGSPLEVPLTGTGVNKK